MSLSTQQPSAFSAWNKGLGFHSFRDLIWDLADPNKESYNPMRAISLLSEAIKGKWMLDQFARTEMGAERAPQEELDHFMPKPIVDNGPEGVDQQLRVAVNSGLRYLSTPTLGWEPEMPCELARKKLGYTHPMSDDTPEQIAAWIKEERRIIYEAELKASIYELGEAVDERHRAFLEGNVSKWQKLMGDLDIKEHGQVLRVDGLSHHI